MGVASAREACVAAWAQGVTKTPSAGFSLFRSSTARVTHFSHGPAPRVSPHARPLTRAPWSPCSWRPHGRSRRGSGGRQLKVEEGQQLDIDYRDVSTEEKITFDRVLACRDESGLSVGRPLIESAAVTAEVIAVVQGPKLVVQKVLGPTMVQRRSLARK